MFFQFYPGQQFSNGKPIPAPLAKQSPGHSHPFRMLYLLRKGYTLKQILGKTPEQENLQAQSCVKQSYQDAKENLQSLPEIKEKEVDQNQPETQVIESDDTKSTYPLSPGKKVAGLF